MKKKSGQEGEVMSLGLGMSLSSVPKKEAKSKKERRLLGRDERPKPLTKKERKEKRMKRKLKEEKQSAGGL